MAARAWDPERGVRSLIENASDVITVLGPDLTIVFQTSSCTRLLGYPTEELDGSKFASIVHPADLSQLRLACATVADGIRSDPVDLRLRHSDGEWIDVETVVRHQADEGHLVLTTRDARERKRAERKLRQQADQQAVVAELGARALEGGELHELVLLAASEVCHVLGADFAGLHQHVPERESFVLAGGVGLESFRRNGATIAGPGSWLEHVLAGKQAHIISDWGTSSEFSEAAFLESSGIASGIGVPVPGAQQPFGVLSVQAARGGHFNYEHGVFLRSVANVLAAAIARQEAEAEVRHQALHDAVTGLPNRILFEDRLTRVLATARRHHRSLAVLFLDLDHFKRVNDSLGHSVGDQVLQAVARRMSACLRVEDTLARFGGDEFVVLMPEIEREEDWAHVVDRIDRTLQRPLDIDGRQIVTSMSVGVAIGGALDPSKDAQALVRDADLAMYAAKQRGPGRREVFEKRMYDAAVQRLDLIGDLHQALDREEFRVHYQPIVALEDQRIVGLEALVRWEHPHHGLLLPAAFLPLAEETGLIIPLGEMVLREACRRLARWQQSHPANRDMYVSVNLSTQEVHRTGLVAGVRRVLEDTGIRPETLVLEITEGVLLTTEDEALQALNELRGLGVQLAVDDFGTGYSALSYLQRLPVSILKIDKAFVDRVGADQDQERLLNGIIKLAHDVNLATVAEGIETQEQAEALRRLHAELGQGFHYSRPTTAEEIDRLLAGSGALLTGSTPGAPPPSATSPVASRP
jgi:diguanylate cyclase (GGDEF)-like protein/PAS domain S-box-containing protein